MSPQVVNDGVGLGTVIAVVISWSRNRSILWAIFHGICSWFYVIYYAFTRRRDDEVEPRRLTLGTIVVIFSVLALFILVCWLLFSH